MMKQERASADSSGVSPARKMGQESGWWAEVLGGEKVHIGHFKMGVIAVCLRAVWGWPRRGRKS